MSLRPMLLVCLLGLTTAAAQTPAPATSDPATPPKVVQASTRPVNDTGPDARMCLEYPTVVQVIKCAEKYLPRRAAAAKA